MSRLMKRQVIPFVAVFAWSGASGAAEFFGPLPYLSAADSPFASLGANLSIEDFEDGLLNQLGVSVSPGTTVLVAPDPLNDSVDADDGVIDGNGTAGRSLYSGGTLSRIDFRFDAALRGSLPSHVGIVWTDVGGVTSGTEGFGDVTFEAYDAADQLIGTIGPSILGNGTAAGTEGTGEDRFFGVIHAPGVARISVVMGNSVDWEVDHLQFNAAPVPLPATVWLAGPALAGLIARRRRAPG